MKYMNCTRLTCLHRRRCTNTGPRDKCCHNRRLAHQPRRAQGRRGHDSGVTWWVGTTCHRNLRRMPYRGNRFRHTARNTNPWQYRRRCTNIGQKDTRSRPLLVNNSCHWSACMNWYFRTNTDPRGMHCPRRCTTNSLERKRHCTCTDQTGRKCKIRRTSCRSECMNLNSRTNSVRSDTIRSTETCNTRSGSLESPTCSR